MIVLVCLLLQGCNRAALRGIAQGLNRANMSPAEQQEDYQRRQTKAAERQAKAAERQAEAAERQASYLQFGY